jgi:hypothetical protein
VTERRDRRWLRVLGGGAVLGLIGVLVGKLLFPGAGTLPPPLLRELPARYDQASATFTARLRARFPVGSSENKMVVALVAQGFKVSPVERTADWKQPGLPCTEIARVWWSAAQGNVTRVEGLRNAICP